MLTHHNNNKGRTGSAAETRLCCCCSSCMWSNGKSWSSSMLTVNQKDFAYKKKKRWKKYRPWQSNDIVVLIAKKWPFWHIWHGDDETSVAQNITEYIKERLQRFKKCQTISICGKKISANEEGSVQKMSRIKPQVIQENG